MRLHSELKNAKELEEYFGNEHREATRRAKELEAANRKLCRERARACKASRGEYGSVEEVLQAAAGLFRRRLVVFPIAVKSAADCWYRKPDEVFQVMTVLAASAGGHALDIRATLRNQFGRRVR